MTTAELRKAGIELLSRAGFDSPSHECDYILSGALKLPLLELQLDPQREIDSSRSSTLLEMLHRRALHEPAQYILGTASFRELELQVTPAVLIPRPETEELVTLALKHAFPGARVLDMGTGSGAIPIALKTERPDLQLTAADLSSEALAVARANAALYNAEIEFLSSDLWQALQGRIFDLVTANLPYVSEDEYKQCSSEIFFEPVMALTAPHDGLELMEKMIRELHEHLSPGGCAIFELSPWQNPLICTLGKSLEFKANAVNDLEGKARFVILQKECSPLCS